MRSWIVMRAMVVLASGLVLACGGTEVGADASTEPEGAEARNTKPAPPSSARPGDSLLASARSSIRDGQVAAGQATQLRASKDPAHARAARLLAAMETPLPSEAEPPPSTDSAALVVPPAIGEAPPIERTAETPKSTTPKSTGPATPAPPSGGPTQVGKVSLRSSRKGATLTLAAPSSLVVGIANQTSSGIVHLIIESARANAAVLRARPTIDGAKVTAVRQGQRTIQITLQLDPGWSLGRVTPTSGGAKVHLRAPGE